jgi:hypothetical protein
MKRHPLAPILAIAALALAGLVIGLTGETYEDVFANLALGLCLVPIGWAALRR